MKKAYENKPFKLAVGVLAVIGGLWILNNTLFEPIQYVSLCDANRLSCQTIKAEFFYDGMDGQFVMEKLYREDSTVTFGPTDCWVKVSGSACMNSSTNQNMTGIENVIVPLAYELRSLRWNRD